MLSFESNKGVRFCSGLTRRDFLRAGTACAGAVGLSLADLNRLKASGRASSEDINCIVLFLVGGPSHLDTWDLKPHAPESIRGPFRPIQTDVPGMQICEHFPRMARMASRYALLRSVHHRAAPIHETGHQLMQTGRLFRGDQQQPHFGSVVSHLRGPRPSGLPPFVVAPGPIGNTGVSVSHGQSAGILGARHEPFVLRGDPANGYHLADLSAANGLDPARLRSRNTLLEAIDRAQATFDAAEANRTADDAAVDTAYNALFSQNARRAFDLSAERDDLRSRYGRNTFGQSCLLARRLVEHGVRLVTVNMFDTVFNKATWDCHADGGALGSTLNDYRDPLCPMFDAAYTSLLEDLHQRGMLANTLVVAMGEFGRTPHLNAGGGRDHWPGAWSILFAGARVRGGQVIGATDRIGAEPLDRPISAAEVAATVYKGMGIDLQTRIPGPDNQPIALAEAAAVDEVFGG